MYAFAHKHTKNSQMQEFNASDLDKNPEIDWSPEKGYDANDRQKFKIHTPRPGAGNEFRANFFCVAKMRL